MPPFLHLQSQKNSILKSFSSSDPLDSFLQDSWVMYDPIQITQDKLPSSRALMYSNHNCKSLFKISCHSCGFWRLCRMSMHFLRGEHYLGKVSKLQLSPKSEFMIRSRTQRNILRQSQYLIFVGFGLESGCFS